MSVHIERKNAVKTKITSADDIKLIISRCALDMADKDILRMLLAEKHEVNYVADMLGYSASTIKRRFSKALPVFTSVGKKLHLL